MKTGLLIIFGFMPVLVFGQLVTCVKKGKTGKLNTSEWVLGWLKVAN